MFFNDPKKEGRKEHTFGMSKRNGPGILASRTGKKTTGDDILSALYKKEGGEKVRLTGMWQTREKTDCCKRKRERGEWLPQEGDVEYIWNKRKTGWSVLICKN